MTYSYTVVCSCGERLATTATGDAFQRLLGFFLIEHRHCTPDHHSPDGRHNAQLAMAALARAGMPTLNFTEDRS